MKIIRVILLILLPAMLMLHTAAPSYAAGGAHAGLGAPMRPRIANSTVHTAWGSPIRGITNSWIGYDDFDYVAAKTRELIGHVRESGLNALHLYTGDTDEYGARLPVGAEAGKIDFVVEEAAKNGIYVIMTIGYVDFDSPAEVAFLNNFWDFYSMRYKDNENVIFEIANEHGWPGNGAEIVADVYNIIRRNAPDTMVLLYSFAVSAPPEYLLPRIDETMRLVDIPWTNEAVAFHAYESRNDDAMGDTWLNHVVDAFVARGYPIINTEVPCRFELTQHPDVGIYNVLEQKGIAWLGFVNENLIGRPARWRGPFDAGGVAWAPDYGDWPAMGAIYPFEKRAAASNVFGTTAAAVTDRGRRVMHMESGDYVTYSRVGFGSREPLSFLLGISSPGGGSIVVREGGPGGRVLGECALPASAEGFDACNAYAGGPLMAAVGGIADITFTYEGSGTAVFRDWQFVLPKQISYTDPQKIIDAANYPYRTGDIVRRPSTDGGSPAELHVEGIMDGSSLLFDFVRFRDSINTSFNIRAMPLAGGSIEIWAGDFETCVWLLGICEIDGPAGAWADFSCALDMEQVQTGWTHAHTSNTRWDLKLVFTGEPGQELFAISEFYMGGGDSGGSGEGGGSGSGGKPARADRHAPKVYTGHANSVTAATAKVSFSKLSGFEDLDVLEAGIMLSLDESFSDYIELIANPSDISSILSYYTIRLDLSGALEAFGSPDLSNAPDLFWNIRAYAKTNDGIYLGGVRRFAPAGG